MIKKPFFSQLLTSQKPQAGSMKPPSMKPEGMMTKKFPSDSDADGGMKPPSGSMMTMKAPSDSDEDGGISIGQIPGLIMNPVGGKEEPHKGDIDNIKDVSAGGVKELMNEIMEMLMEMLMKMLASIFKKR